MLIMYINVRTVYILGGVLFVSSLEKCHDFRKNQLLRVLTSEQRHDDMIFQEWATLLGIVGSQAQKSGALDTP